jgi:hypothetical protein
MLLRVRADAAVWGKGMEGYTEPEGIGIANNCAHLHALRYFARRVPLKYSMCFKNS